MTHPTDEAAVERMTAWEQVGYWKERARQADEARDTVNAHLPKYQQALSDLKAERQRAEQAIMECSRLAAALGEAEGRLKASALYGVVDGWKQRAEQAEKKLAKAREGLEQRIDNACAYLLADAGIWREMANGPTSHKPYCEASARLREEAAAGLRTTLKEIEP